MTRSVYCRFRGCFETQAAVFDPSCFDLYLVEFILDIDNEVVRIVAPKRDRNAVSSLD